MKLFDQKFSVVIGLAPVYEADMQCVRFQNSDMVIKFFFLNKLPEWRYPEYKSNVRREDPHWFSRSKYFFGLFMISVKENEFFVLIEDP
jgi:hypothetical protein